MAIIKDKGVDISEIERVLREEGRMVAESFMADGRIYRCGTKDKPQSKNGSYIIHLDPPASAWCMDWASGDEPKKWCVKPEAEMTDKEKKAWKLRVEEDRKKREVERDTRHAEAARKAKREYDGYPDTRGGVYLRKKGVRSVKGLKDDKHGNIVMPILNDADDIVSLQYIDGKGGKMYLAGGQKQGCRFPIPADPDCTDDTLYLAEGLATAASVHEATKAEVWVALDAGNLSPVARTARSKYPSRRIVIAADNDAYDSDGAKRPDEKNVGLTKAKAAAMESGTEVSLCPIIDDKSTDFNDLHVRLGIDAVRNALGQTLDMVTCPMPSGFHMTDDGLFKEVVDRRGEVTRKRIGAPMEVIGYAMTEDANEHALVLRWHDTRGNAHKYAMPKYAPHLRDEEWVKTIIGRGYDLEHGSRSELADFLCRVRPIRDYLYVSGTGWHGSSYVRPRETIGPSGSKEAIFRDGLDDELYQTAGTFDGWMEAARLAVGNTRMVFALTVPFAATMLYDTGIDGGGFNLEGGSSCGKTRSMMLAVSVIGNPDIAGGQMRSWRATANGLETVAAMCNDGMLALDEIGQATGRDLSEALYMIANGGGKTRASKTGGIRRRATWRTMLLSTGELGVSAKLEADGLTTMAGQEVRLVGIRCGREHVTDLHGYADSAALIGRIEEILAHHYGHAIRRFLRHYVDERRGLYARITDAVDANARSLCGTHTESQVLRVARRFALCIVAGGIARDAGCLPAEMDIEAAVKTCFTDWLGGRGDGDLEDTKILKAVRHFIEKYGASRFQDIRTPEARCIDRVGYVEYGDEYDDDRDPDVYYVLPECFEKDLLKGHDVKRACRVLIDAGWLEIGDGKHIQSRKRLPGIGCKRCYKLVIPTKG